MVGIFGLAALVVAVAFIVRVVVVGSVSNRVAGAPGYSTYTGPSGLPLKLGAPWGQRCQPVVVVVEPGVPMVVYREIEAAVLEARADGVDVAVTNLSQRWYSDALYPSGQTESSVRFVQIWPDEGPPSRDRHGKPDRLQLGWDARVTSDGRHETLKYLQATLWMRTVGTDRLEARLATRRIIAYSQGVSGTPSTGSGIAWNATVDSFTNSDLHAMATMSGCDYQSAPPPPTYPVPPSQSPLP